MPARPRPAQAMKNAREAAERSASSDLKRQGTIQRQGTLSKQGSFKGSPNELTRQASTQKMTPELKKQESLKKEFISPSEKKEKEAAEMGLEQAVHLTDYWDIEKALDGYKEWPEKVNGYKDLIYFILFYVIYSILIIMQVSPWDSFAVNSSLANVVAGYDTVATQNDFFTYANTLMGNIFVKQWYNSEIFTVEESGYINSYNKLVGGVLIIQERGVEAPCEESLYRSFYGNCHLEKRAMANFSTNSTIQRGNYSYDSEQGGYAQFFTVALTSDQVSEALTKLSNTRWLDKNTRKLFIKFAVYNGEYEMFAFAKISFTFGTGGVMFGNNIAEIQACRMELYKKPDDWGRLALEILFLYISAWFLSEEILDFAETVMSTRDPKTDQIDVKQGVKNYFLSAWNYCDLLNHALIISYIAARMALIVYVVKNPIKLPTNKYQVQLEEVAALNENAIFIISLNIFVKIVHIFKYVSFQPRMNIISSTISKAIPDLFHFFLLFFAIFYSYGVMTIIIFGPHMKEFSSIGLVTESLGLFVLGTFDPYATMRLTNPLMATLLFWTFIIVVFFIMTNVFLAIVVDAYADSKVKADNATGIHQDIGRALIQVLTPRPKGAKSKLPDDPLKEALLYFKGRGLKTILSEDIECFMREVYGIEDSEFMERNEGVLRAMQCHREKDTPNVEMEQLLQAAWNKYDADHSGFLDGDEFKAFMNDAPVKLDPSQTARLDQLLKEADVDGDGLISYEEFVPVFNSVMLEGLAIASKKAMETQKAAAKAKMLEEEPK